MQSIAEAQASLLSALAALALAAACALARSCISLVCTAALAFLLMLATMKLRKLSERAMPCSTMARRCCRCWTSAWYRVGFCLLDPILAMPDGATEALRSSERDGSAPHRTGQDAAGNGPVRLGLRAARRGD